MKQAPVHCRQCWEKATTIFQCLSETNIETLDRAKIPHVYEHGQIIFYEGNPAFALYCISAGNVKLYKSDGKGDTQVIRILGSGDIMGYRALFANEPYAATAEAVDTTIVCAIPKEALFSLLRQSPELAFAFLTKLSHELRISEEQSLSFAHDSVQQRTARFLLSLVTTAQQQSTTPIQLHTPLNHNEIAQVIGTTPETLSRTLHDFAQRGILRIERSALYILDLQRLKHLAKL